MLRQKILNKASTSNWQPRAVKNGEVPSGHADPFGPETKTRDNGPGLFGRFAEDEDGGITILTIVLLVAMLVVGGMAVDFMHYESERVELQSVSDRAVLAAADLSQTLPPAVVVQDFFETAGFGHTIVGVPTIIDSGNSRTVRVDAELHVDTFYLRLVGIDQLQAPARSQAIEGVGKVEISLVLDISGSMRNGGSGSAGRFGDMQDAAKSFASLVLHPRNGGQVSLNIVPYAGATNPGTVVFDYLKGVRYNSARTATTSSEMAEEDFSLDANVSLQTSPIPNVSSCLEFAEDDWTMSGLPGRGRDQVPHFMNWEIVETVMDWGWCPQDSSAIRYAIQDSLEAAEFINSLRMHDGTGTHYAMKYGLAALDPTTQPAFEQLNGETYRGVGGVLKPQVPDDFTNRPAAWDDSETRKIIVLMTDGRITEQVRPIDPLNELNHSTELDFRPDSDKFVLTQATRNVDSFDAICALAKDPARDVEVFTVAFEVDGDGADQMRDCASESAMYFETSGSGLTKVFEDIARQITDLRLSL